MKVLIVVDMQNDFIDGALGTPEAVAIVDAVAKRIRSAKVQGESVWFTRDTHGKNYLETQEGHRLPVPHCIQGTQGWQLSDRLAADGCPVIDKPTFGSLQLTEAIAALPNVESIELVGLCTDICVISNALLLKARLPEIPIAVRASCCAGVTPESHRHALEAMRSCQIQILED